VSVAVLTEDETRSVFGVAMQDKDIQPVWLRIDNASEEVLLFLIADLDPDYFSSHEASWKNHFFLGGKENEKMDDHLYREKLRIVVPARDTVEGFVYTNRDYGLKVVSVNLLGEGKLLGRRIVVVAQMPPRWDNSHVMYARPVQEDLGCLGSGIAFCTAHLRVFIECAANHEACHTGDGQPRKQDKQQVHRIKQVHYMGSLLRFEFALRS